MTANRAKIEDESESTDILEKKVDVKDIWKEMKLQSTSSTSEVKLTPETSNLQSKSQPAQNSTSRPKKGGLDNLINSLGKKKQISTLEKSKQDWNRFKQKQGIEFQAELSNHVKGSNSYLEKQAFLQRTDLREFEREKVVRLKKQSTNNNNT